ncbi:hypothetical protein C8J57DRAFT_1275784 [Mycena rebaudengoi]|nr:hypothetical protein C8J57DRAFT_1275784 [Mycena rebaudengoi]
MTMPHATPTPTPSSFKGAFVDSSNRQKRVRTNKSKPHSHLRTSSAPSVRKSPPTCTISLASISALPLVFTEVTRVSQSDSDSLLFPGSCVPFPGSDSSGCWDGNDGDAAPDAESSPAAPWRRPRARTSHVETPRKATNKRTSCTAPSASNPKLSARLPRPPKRAAATAELRFTALVERSITQNLLDNGTIFQDEWDNATHECDANPGADANPCADSDDESPDPCSAFAWQDAHLARRLRRSLAQQGWSAGRAPSPLRTGPVGISLQARPPSVLLSGGAVPFPGAPQQLTFKTPSPPLTITIAPFASSPRPRSSLSPSRSKSPSNLRILPLPGLVATLILRRHNDRTALRAVRSPLPDPGDSAPSPRKSLPSPLAG